MADELIVAPQSEMQLGTLIASSPESLVAGASAMATTLAEVINRQGLFTKIQGRDHVRVEGWTTLAMMLGCVAREVSNDAQPDGSFVAVVELVRVKDGAVISRASSECGDETDGIWWKRPRYAKRSMAATRATGKACRLAFSWIMTLAGYETTPAEEMPHDEPARDVTPRSRQQRQTAEPPYRGQEAREERPAAPKAPGKISAAQRNRLFAIVGEEGKRANLTVAQAHEELRAVASRYGYASTADITTEHYDKIIAETQETIRALGPPPDPAAEAFA